CSGIGVRLELGGRAHQPTLQTAVAGVESGKTHHLAADPLPRRVGIKPEATGVESRISEHQAIPALFLELLAVPCWHRQAAFGVQIDGGFTKKHGSALASTKKPLNPTISHLPSPYPAQYRLSSSFNGVAARSERPCGRPNRHRKRGYGQMRNAGSSAVAWMREEPGALLRRWPVEP